MSAPIDFYFDFSSPYGYFMAEKIDALAARFERKVRWKPILLGVVYQTTGGAPLPSLPLKGAYAATDIARTARFLGLPFRLPDSFPIATQQAARAYYWLHGQDCPMARAFALAAYRHYFAEGKDISAPETVAQIAAGVGADAGQTLATLQEPEVKARLKDACAAAVERGVCGSPYVIIDDEPFWGADRLPQIERWLVEGGF